MPTPGGFQQSVYVLTTVADINHITTAEIEAGQAIHEDLPNPLNFAGTTNYMDTSVIASRQDRSEPGTLTPDNLSFEVFRRRGNTTAVAITALEDEANVVLVKFEGGNIADGDHGDVADDDVYDAVEVTIGTKTDVDTPRGDPRRMMVPASVNGTVVRDGVIGSTPES
jgi:hypothetical protein